MTFQHSAFHEPPRPRNAALTRKVRHAAGDRATDRADANTPGWAELAYAFLVRFARRRTGAFLTEEVIIRSKGHVPEPHDPKAWGGVVRRAQREGVIRRVGWSCNTRNASPKPTWQRSP